MPLRCFQSHTGQWGSPRCWFGLCLGTVIRCSKDEAGMESALTSGGWKQNAVLAVKGYPGFYVWFSSTGVVHMYATDTASFVDFVPCTIIPDQPTLLSPMDTHPKHMQGSGCTHWRSRLMFPTAGKRDSRDSRVFAFVPPSIHMEMPGFICVPSSHQGGPARECELWKASGVLFIGCFIFSLPAHKPFSMPGWKL